MAIRPYKKKIIDFVEDAYSVKLCLPAFQRDFVWKRSKVADLIRSILKRYYIGQLLLLPCDPRLTLKIYQEASFKENHNGSY